MPPPITLTAENICIERGGRLVLDGVSFAVRAGDALMVTGPNGTGKTTLLRAIAGFLTPVSGNLALSGGDAERDIGQQCHYAGHADAVKVRLTVAENLRFWAHYFGGSEARVGAALTSLDLAELSHISAAYLSAGQRRRLGLARLLVAARPIWLLDEPTVSLDSASSQAFARLIEDHRSSGGMVIAATHTDLGLNRPGSLRLSAQQRAAA